MEKGNLPSPYRIVAVEPENENTKTWILDGRLDAQPGQFVMVWLPQIDEKPFSLAGADPITLTVTRVGAFTAALHQLGPGDQLWLRGPIGMGYTLQEGPALLVGGGYGAAPLWFLARRARASGQAVHVALGARTASLLVLEQRFVDLGCELHVATDDGSKGRRGVVTDLVAELLGAVGIGALYGCGPDPMLHALEALANQRAMPCQLSHEANMMCGMGVCGSCTRGEHLVCRDGPVFVVNN
jgi:dihydroorotate dehydrogenase electron transfer subunit